MSEDVVYSGYHDAQNSEAFPTRRPQESSQNPVTENRGSWELRGQCLKASVFMSKGAPSSGVSTLQVAQKTRPESDVKEVQLQVNFWEERFETNYSLKFV